jgi:hypothetical protein
MSMQKKRHRRTIMKIPRSIKDDSEYSITTIVLVGKKTIKGGSHAG